MGRGDTLPLWKCQLTQVLDLPPNLDFAFSAARHMLWKSSLF
jgi:hypothetical protein